MNITEIRKALFPLVDAAAVDVTWGGLSHLSVLESELAAACQAYLALDSVWLSCALVLPPVAEKGINHAMQISDEVIATDGRHQWFASLHYGKPGRAQKWFENSNDEYSLDHAGIVITHWRKMLPLP